ncbi:ATP-dependent helicase [Clostridium sp. MD294]|uniref:ATP-dependent helicase n=1 Tax=Clostridium sp. MD294 TaxID=97138 RepID=UPI0002C9FA7C|nr:ATP-dependent helicase [Clostridium sp. MD294]NDO46740.1 ATP-dependent helicase [Clostridium sp. MD294]USF28819.1 Putative ATP-dependent DNA helicase YjcD [Clostridium sp. MD294]
MDFNIQQQKAIKHHKGAMLVLAGPGSGKTTVIIYRIKYLIEQHNVAPEKILVVTYTKAAATEMQQRFLKLNVIGGDKVIFGTFHNIFFRILRKAYHYRLEQIMSEDEKWNFFKKLIIESEIETNDIEEYVKDLLGEISLMKNELLSLKQYQPINFETELFQFFVKKYERYKAYKNKIDFDDMLTQCYEYLTLEEQARKYWQQRFEYILLDEYQDINQAQNACISMLAEPQNNIFAVGDDDQSIYCFRGARPEFLLQFPQKYENSEKVILSVNYRSTEKIIKLSEKIICHNKKRFAKNMYGERGEGEKIIFFTEKDAYQEAERIAYLLMKLRKKGIHYSEMAVIYRTNIQGGIIAGALTQKGIPFILKDKGSNLYSHWITKDLTSYLILAEDIYNNAEFRRIVNKPKRYISRELLEQTEKSDFPLLKALYASPHLRKYQAQYLQDLEAHLIQIKKRKPLEALKYIRNIVGYDDYLKQYASFRKASLEGYLEIAEEITQFASVAEDTESFLNKLKEMENEMIQKNKRSNMEQIQGVTLSTMHSAKGLEFEAVFVPSIVEEIIPHKKSETSEQIEEERRLFYVAVTRAKSILYLSEITKRHDKKTKRSCFLKELGL